MKFVLLGLLVAVACYGYRTHLTKQAKGQIARSALRWVIPVILGGLAIFATLFFNLNFNGKIL